MDALPAFPLIPLPTTLRFYYVAIDRVPYGPDKLKIKRKGVVFHMEFVSVLESVSMCECLSVCERVVCGLGEDRPASLDG